MWLMSGGTAMFGETAWKPERVIDYSRRDRKSHLRKHKMKKSDLIIDSRDIIRVNVGSI